MPESAREKISMFSHVAIDQVISMPDVNNIFKVPLVLYEHKIAEWLAERLSLTSVTQRLARFNSSSSSSSSSSSNAANTQPGPRGGAIPEHMDTDSQPTIMQRWAELSDRADSLSKEVAIALVGKYTTQSDTYTSIVKSLEHAGLESNRKVVIKYIDSSSLEKTVEAEDPVKYHEAWQVVCKSE
jgi:CTP synthase